MAKATVAISQDFFNSFAALPKSKQNRVMEFLSKFRSNPEANGFNYEKIQNVGFRNLPQGMSREMSLPRVVDIACVAFRLREASR